jgi:hypothetical protein
MLTSYHESRESQLKMAYKKNPNIGSTGSTGWSNLTGSMSLSASTLLTNSGTVITYKQPVPPTNWNKISISSPSVLGTSHVHEPPITGRTAYFASLMISNHYGAHHWDVFKTLHPDIEFLACGVAEEDDTNMVSTGNIIFLNEADHTTFENWFSQYLDMFGSKEALYSYKLPPPPPVMSYSVQIPIGKHENVGELFIWLMTNCQDRVYSLANYLFFLNDSDATLYKLKYSA